MENSECQIKKETNMSAQIKMTGEIILGDSFFYQLIQQLRK